jgi:hypothetical protein
MDPSSTELAYKDAKGNELETVSVGFQPEKTVMTILGRHANWDAPCKIEIKRKTEGVEDSLKVESSVAGVFLNLQTASRVQKRLRENDEEQELRKEREEKQKLAQQLLLALQAKEKAEKEKTEAQVARDAAVAALEVQRNAEPTIEQLQAFLAKQT